MTSHFNTIKFIFRLKDTTWIANDHIKDAQEMPFKSRLEEIRNIAGLNISIIQKVEGKEEDLNKAKEIIKNIRNSVTKNYPFTIQLNSRLI